MKTIKLPSQAELKALFDYNPETGVLTWKVKPKNNRVKIGDAAGSQSRYIYLRVQINKISYFNHEIIK